MAHQLRLQPLPSSSFTSSFSSSAAVAPFLLLSLVAHVFCYTTAAASAVSPSTANQFAEISSAFSTAAANPVLPEERDRPGNQSMLLITNEDGEEAEESDDLERLFQEYQLTFNASIRGQVDFVKGDGKPEHRGRADGR